MVEWHEIPFKQSHQQHKIHTVVKLHKNHSSQLTMHCESDSVFFYSTTRPVTILIQSNENIQVQSHIQ